MSRNFIVYTKLIRILKGVIVIMFIVTHNAVLYERRREKRRGKEGRR